MELRGPARPRPGPDPEPDPDPGPDLALLTALAALAGITDPGALLQAVAVPWAAAREQRLHLDRGAARRKASGGTPWKLPFAAIVTAAACHQRLRMPYRLLAELLGAHETTMASPPAASSRSWQNTASPNPSRESGTTNASRG